MSIASTTLSRSNVGDKSVTLSWTKADLSNNNVKTASILLYDVSLNTIKSTPIPSNLLTASILQGTADVSNSLIFNDLINGHGYEASIIGYNSSNVQTIGSTDECSFTPSGPPDAVVLSNATFDSSNNNISINCLFGNNGGTPIKSLILTVFANDASGSTPDVSYNVINFGGNVQIKNNKFTAIIPALNYAQGAVNTIAGVALNTYGQSEISNSVFVQTSSKPAQGIFLSALSGVYGNVNTDASGNVTVASVDNISGITGNSGINPVTFKSVIPVSFSFGYENSNKSVTGFKVTYIGYARAENMDGSGNLGNEHTQIFPIPPNYSWSDSNVFNVNLVPGKNYVAFKDFRVLATNEKGDSPISKVDPKITAVTVLPPILPDISGNNYTLAVDISSCTVTFPSQITRDISANEPIIYSVKLRDQSNNDLATLSTTLNSVTFFSTFKEKVVYTAEIVATCDVNPSLTDFWAIPALTELKSNKIKVSGYISVSPDTPTNLATITDVINYGSGPLSSYTTKTGVVGVSWTAPIFSGFIPSNKLEYVVTIMTNTSDESAAQIIPNTMNDVDLKQLFGVSTGLSKFKKTITTTGITNAFFSELGVTSFNSSQTRIPFPTNTPLFVNVRSRNGTKISNPLLSLGAVYCNGDTFDALTVNATSLPSVDGGATSKVNVTIPKPATSTIPTDAIPQTVKLFRGDDSESGSPALLQTFGYDANAASYNFTDSLSSSNKKFTYSASIEGVNTAGNLLQGLTGYSSQVSYVSRATVSNVNVTPDINAGTTVVQFTLIKNGTGPVTAGIVYMLNSTNGTASAVITGADDAPGDSVIISKTLPGLSLDSTPNVSVLAATARSTASFPDMNNN
jgi:hypothetical protein